MLRVENLPAVGLLLGFITIAYLGFRRKFIRLGADVDALLAEKERQLAERDKQLAEVKADRDKWMRTAWDAAQAARQVAAVNREAVSATAGVLGTVANAIPGMPEELRRKESGANG